MTNSRIPGSVPVRLLVKCGFRDKVLVELPDAEFGR
jgi:hypothetical protein